MTTKADWARRRHEVRERDNHECQICRSKDNLTVHHIEPRSKGGTDEIHNLILLDADCHKAVHRAYAIGLACPDTFWSYVKAMRITEDWEGAPDGNIP